MRGRRRDLHRLRGTSDDFPGYSGEGSLEEISWDELFDKFEEKNLALLYLDEEVEAGEPSRFNKLVSRDSAGERSH